MTKNCKERPNEKEDLPDIVVRCGSGGLTKDAIAVCLKEYCSKGNQYLNASQ